MTYKDLVRWINSLSDEQKQMDVTILTSHNHEFFPLATTGINESNMDMYDVLDVNHPYLVIE